MGAAKLNARQLRFVELMLTGQYSATQAYIKAGYSKGGAETGASKMLRNAKIAAILRPQEEKKLDGVKRAIAALEVEAYADPLAFFDEATGSFRSIKDIPPELRCTMESFEVEQIEVKTAGGQSETRFVLKKFKRTDRLKARDMLAKIKGWYVPEKIEVTAASMTDEQIAERLAPLLLKGKP